MNERITIVAAIGPGYKIREHQAAIERTAAALPLPSRQLLIERPEIASLANYSRFILFNLWPHIETEFALIVQWDGYGVNRGKWTDDFLKWDYIGATWPAYMATPDQRVGNGGFSLRSTKWLLAGKDNRDWRGEPEDVFCCRTHQSNWLAAGCRIAPAQLAMRFSIEHPCEEWPHWTSKDSFGFHGWFSPDREKYRIL